MNELDRVDAEVFAIALGELMRANRIPNLLVERENELYSLTLTENGLFIRRVPSDEVPIVFATPPGFLH